MNSPLTNLFASIYEWFGINPLYSADLGAQLRGWSPNCTGVSDGTEWYVYIGISMILITIAFYVAQYHIFDSSRYMLRRHWWLTALFLTILNFLVGFTIPFDALQARNYCASGDNALHFNSVDCFGFALTNAIWGLVLFILITSTPLIRRFSNNCRHTTFWKP